MGGRLDVYAAGSGVFTSCQKYLKMGAMTIPSLMEARYGKGTKTMFSLVIVIMYSILNLPVILYSGAVVFEQIFDISGILGTSKFMAVAILCIIIGIIGGCYGDFRRPESSCSI